jgi:hypothetical protein
MISGKAHRLYAFHSLNSFVVYAHYSKIVSPLIKGMKWFCYKVPHVYRLPLKQDILMTASARICRSSRNALQAGLSLPPTVPTTPSGLSWSSSYLGRINAHRYYSTSTRYIYVAAAACAHT